MALIDKASLLMVPSTYEAGKLYNVLPSGNRAPDSTGENSGYDQTRADFDFDRGTNAAATRVNADGLIEKYRENRVLYSNDFTNAAWIKFYTGVTDGQQDPFGGTNGTRLVSTGIGGYIYQNGVCIANTRMTASFWVKSNTGVNQDFVFTANGGNQSSSAITTTTSWQRVSFTFSSSSNGDILFGYQTTQLVDLLIYGFQLEQGLVATDYLESTSVTGKAGVLIDLPRINYDANGENGALLLEPSRANLFTQSEYFGSSYWTKSGDVTLASNYGTSPEGVQNADRIVANATSGGHIVYRNISTTGTHTISIFAKASGYNHLFLGYDGGSLNFGIIFNLSNGTIAQNPAGLTGSIEAVGSDGWHRCNLTFNYATTSYYFVVAPHDNSGNYNWTGNGTDGILIYGAQLEPNATYASSYIPTMGTSETRAADSCSVTGVSDVIGGTSGTIFFDVVMNESLTNSNYKQFFYYTDSGANQTYMYVSSTNYIVGNERLGNIVSSTQMEAGQRYKIAVTYATNSFKMYVNGSQDATSSSGTPLDNENIISIGSYNGTSEFNEFTFKQYAHFKEVLSDAELATLTTL